MLVSLNVLIKSKARFTLPRSTRHEYMIEYRPIHNLVLTSLRPIPPRTHALFLDAFQQHCTEHHDPERM